MVTWTHDPTSLQWEYAAKVNNLLPRDSEAEKRKVRAPKIPSLTPMYVYGTQMDNYLISIHSLDLGSILTPSQLPSPCKSTSTFFSFTVNLLDMCHYMCV